jgi:LacI family transcriptional regulator
VSRVLNGSGTVSSLRAERVRASAAALGYQPFGPAQALRQQRTRVWAAVIADIENPFFTAMVRGIEDVARDAGYRLMLCNSDGDTTREAAYIDIAIAERMAGVVIAVASTSGSTLEPLLDRDVPVVAVDRRTEREGVDSVVVDNRLGAEQATTHLLDAGWKRVACITGPARVSTADERLEGYRSALVAAGKRVDRSLVKRADFKEEGGHRAARALLTSRKPPDALFVANNLMTLGALRAAREVGRVVPDDIGVVGFDDAPWTSLTSPPLTVVAQPTYQMGRRAAELLLSASAGGPARHVVLEPQLVVRGSSLRP